MRFSGGLAGVAAAVLIIGGVAVIPSASAADGAAGGAAPASTPGTTLYVDPDVSCSDSGAGTQAEPFCTVQEAANVVDPGQTVEITQTHTYVNTEPVIIARSGTPTEPITFTWATGGSLPYLSPNTQTGKPVLTLQGVHDVTLSHLNVVELGSDEAIAVIGSSDISLANLLVAHETPGGETVSPPAGISIDGASSQVTVSRTQFAGGGFKSAVLASAGATQVTLTTNLDVNTAGGSAFTLDGTTGAVVTGNSVVASCVPSDGAAAGVAFANGSSGSVENNVLVAGSGPTCATPAVGLSVDASSANSAGGVTADYNAFYTTGPSSEYSWAGTSYSDQADFTAATGQGAHDLRLPTEFTSTRRWVARHQLRQLLRAGGADHRLRRPTVGARPAGDRRRSRQRQLQRQPWRLRAAGRPALHFAAPALNSAGVRGRGGAVQHRRDDHGRWHQHLGRAGQLHGRLRRRQLVRPGHPGTAQPTRTRRRASTRSRSARRHQRHDRHANVETVYALADSGPTAGLSAAPTGLGTTTGIESDTAVFTASPGSTGWEIASSVISYGGSGTGSGSGIDGIWEYTYAQPGTYTATITVTDKIGRSSTAKATITVGDEPQDVYPFSDYDHSVAGHGLVKIALSKLDGGGCCARGALVDVIVTSPQKAGFVIVYPDGTTRPELSTVQFQAGQAAENSTLATGGTVDFYNGSAGTVNLQIVTYGIDDGYGAYGETYAPVTPVTALPKTKVAGGRTVTFQVAGLHGVPANAADVVLDVTASGGTTAGSFTTYDTTSYGAQAAVSGGYWAKGQQVTRLVMISADGAKEVIENAGAGSAYFTAEVVGYYLYTGSDSVFLPAAPRRLGTVFIPANQSVTMPVAGKDGIPATGTTAVALDLTASEATASGTVAAYADGTALPFLISVSYPREVPVANASIAAVGTDGAIRLYNAGSSTVAVNVDLLGSYYAYP